MKTVALNNLGCSKNLIDGDSILAYLERCGFSVVDDFTQAHIIIVNTCTFIQEATEEAIHNILEMAEYKNDGSCSTLIVSGCFSERYREKVRNQFPEVDLWLGVSNWNRELDHYFNKAGILSFKRALPAPQATQYLKISDGCSHRCSYCIIPSIRGPFKSRTVAAIQEEAQWLSAQGVHECIIVSQDTSFYGRDIDSSLPYLIETLLRTTDFHWIRMMYLHPRYISDDLLDLVASEKRLCPYFDMPLQHIADPILRTMNRIPPGSKEIYHTIERIRHRVPDATIRTAFILGFPGETRKHFQELCDFIEWARFEKMGVFPFSPEEGTKACCITPRPRNSTVRNRCETLMAVQKEISREIGSARIGTTTEIIIDEISDISDFAFRGRTSGDAPEIDGQVFLINGNPPVGSFTEVQIIDADDYDLFAKVPE